MSQASDSNLSGEIGALVLGLVIGAALAYQLAYQQGHRRGTLDGQCLEVCGGAPPVACLELGLAVCNSEPKVRPLSDAPEQP